MPWVASYILPQARVIIFRHGFQLVPASKMYLLALSTREDYAALERMGF